ncbi:MAG: 4Fe-4S dicluster domain-containing protein [Dethiobacter sp.]|jgi:ferredoxin|nr:4Fe-4S dicluster domain-containing protein [Dethiobacter sp.]
MREYSEKMQKIASDALEKKEVSLVIGWRKKDFWWQSPVAFVDDAAQARQLVWDPFTVNNPIKYLLDQDCHEKTGVFVKGCDSRGINRLLQDRRLERDRVVLYGVPCDGKVDAAKLKKAFPGQKIKQVAAAGDQLSVTVDGGDESVPAKEYLLDKCQSCRYPNPVVYDRLAWEEVAPRQVSEESRFSRVADLEQIDVDERFAYWSRQFERCIRCFACRNVCPACNCVTCIFDQAEPRWLGKASDMGDTLNYQMIRAFHVAGRCFECGECERICPAGIPLLDLHRKIIKDLNGYYGEYDAGLNPEDNPPLGIYRGEDPAGFDES